MYKLLLNLISKILLGSMKLRSNNSSNNHENEDANLKGEILPP